jgi:hypothetical protein
MKSYCKTGVIHKCPLVPAYASYRLSPSASVA